MLHQAQKSHFPFLFKIRGDEMGVVGLDKGDLGWGRKELVELDERGEPFTNTTSFQN